MSAIIDVEGLPVTDRVEFLRERMLTAPVPLQLDPHPESDIHVHSRVAELGCVHLLSTKASGADVVRSARLTRATPRHSALITVIESGTSVIDGDQGTVTLRAGDMAVCMTDEPYRLRFTDGTHRHTFQVSFDDLDRTPGAVYEQLGRVIHPDQATSAAVSAFLRSTARNAPRAPLAEQTSLEAPALALIRLLLTRVDAATTRGRESESRSLATRVDEYVRSRLEDPQLSIRSIATTFAISERYVYTILERRGIDLGALMRRHRLARAARMLEDPRAENATIATIAHHCGFADHAHFSRTFRGEFGMSPSEWRQRSRAVHKLPAQE